MLLQLKMLPSCLNIYCSIIILINKKNTSGQSGTSFNKIKILAQEACRERKFY